MFGVDEIILK